MLFNVPSSLSSFKASLIAACKSSSPCLIRIADSVASSDVATICTGMAASMAAVLLVAGQEGKRSALTHSRVMIHQPLGGVQGQASDMEIEVKEIQKFKKELYTIISNHSHTPFEKVWKDSDRNYWMTAEEAKEYGMIDAVLVKK